MDDRKIGPFAVIGFFLELSALAAFVFLGFSQFEPPLSIVVGIGLPLVAMVLWGLFRAPRRTIATPFWVRIVIEVVVIGGGAAALLLANQPVLAAVLGGVGLIAGIVNGRAEYLAEAASPAP